MLGEKIQHADWKTEKHVPVIECPDAVPANTMFEVKVSLGKEIAHPNTTEHHIRWIKVFFQPKGEKFTYDVAKFEFNAHGESTKGPNEGSIYTHHGGSAKMKTGQSGTIIALAYCNIHGLWESTKEITISG
jgi:superoxide reductase